MSKFHTHSALAALLLCSVAAQAATFNFSGSTDFGPLPGVTFSGQFSYSETNLPSDGEVLLSNFTLNFVGQSYTLISASTAPMAAFSGGDFVGLSYLDDGSTNTALRPQVSFTPGFLGLADAHFDYVGSNGQGGFGSYTVSAVPEPGASWLFLVGCGALALRLRRP